jgi:hypothetical protein
MMHRPNCVAALAAATFARGASRLRNTPDASAAVDSHERNVPDR